MQDLRFAFRSIAAHRWFAAAIVATLALGIGINTTVFTLADAVLLRPLPFPAGDRIVAIGSTRLGSTDRANDVSYPDFLDLRAQTSVFERIEAATTGDGTIAETSIPAARFRLGRVTSGVLSATSVAPVLGRTLNSTDDRPDAPLAAVIGFDMWRTRYQESPAVIGRAVRINEQPATIVGVMPEGFGFPTDEEFWIPLRPVGAERDARDRRSLIVLGVLRPGQSIATADLDVRAVAARLAAAYPTADREIGATVQTFNERFNGDRVQTVFLLLYAAVVLVLLVACANVANMMLGTALARRREMSIRAALGASRWAMVRQVLVESLLLSVAGGLLGLALAVAGVRAFDAAVQDVGKPSWVVFAVDYRVVSYCAAVCIGSAVLFGLAPALRSSRVDLNQVLREGGRGVSGRAGWLSGVLVVLQCAFAIVLLTASGLMMRSFVAGEQIDGWIPRREILTARVLLPTARYVDRDACQRFYDALLPTLAALPGVTRAEVMSQVPTHGGPDLRIEMDGRAVEPASTRPEITTVSVSPGYFDLIGLSIPRGRPFDAVDGTPGHEAAIVSRTFAAVYWPHQSPIGHRIRFNDDRAPGPWLTVVGESGDLVQNGNRVAPEPIIFRPFRQDEERGAAIAVRTTGDASRLASALRTTVQAADPDLALDEVQTLEGQLARQQWPYRVFGTMFLVFAMAALLMAGVGLYAVMAQATGRRTREIGIRLALGATPHGILGTVMGRGAAQLGIGACAGLAAAFATTGAMRALLVGVEPSDPMTFAGSTLVLVGVGLLACWLPARRAAAIAPVQALAE